MKQIRLYNWGNEKIKVCKHITINGEKSNSSDSCEYHEDLEISCSICKRKYNFKILVN